MSTAYLTLRRSLRQDAYDPTGPEAGSLSRLLRLVVPQAFSKLDDRAVRGWGVNIQHDIQSVRTPLLLPLRSFSQHCGLADASHSHCMQRRLWPVIHLGWEGKAI